LVHYRRRLVVPVPQQAAFDYMSRFSSAAEWDPSVRTADMVSSEPVRLGSTFALDTVFMGRTVSLRYEIAEYDPPHRVVLVAHNSSVRSTDEITVSTDSSGRTVVEYRADLALRGPTRLAAPVIALVFRRIGDRAAEGLLTALTAMAPGYQS
jgi:hypothetical protein